MPRPRRLCATAFVVALKTKLVCSKTKIEYRQSERLKKIK